MARLFSLKFFKSMGTFATLFGGLLFFSPSVWALKIEFINDCLIPTGERLADEEIGGLSGLAYHSSGLLLAISDFQDGQGSPLFAYELVPQKQKKSFCPQPIGVLLLKGSSNAEAIAINDTGDFYITNEAPSSEISSSLMLYSVNGKKMANLPLPPAYEPKVHLIPKGPEPTPPIFKDFKEPRFHPPSKPQSYKGRFVYGLGWLESWVDAFLDWQWQRRLQSAKEDYAEQVKKMKMRYEDEKRKALESYGQQKQRWLDEHLKKPAGLVYNKALESLSYEKKNKILTTMTEIPLTQDLPIQEGAVNRLLRMQMDSQGRVQSVKEYYYPLNTNRRVSEVLDLGGGQLLTLEIFYDSIIQKVFAELYEVQIDESQGVSSQVFLEKPVELLSKKLLLDLNSLESQLDPSYPKLDNLEGMTLGPRLSQDEISLILVSDNNKSSRQITQFLIFSLSLKDLKEPQ